MTGEGIWRLLLGERTRLACGVPRPRGTHGRANEVDALESSCASLRPARARVGTRGARVLPVNHFGFNCGKRITSRMLSWPRSIMHRRSEARSIAINFAAMADGADDNLFCFRIHQIEDAIITYANAKAVAVL